jgi:hypothetical protein
MKALLRRFRALCIQAVLRLCQDLLDTQDRACGFILDLLRLYYGTVTALLRLYYSTVKAVLRLCWNLLDNDTRAGRVACDGPENRILNLCSVYT